MKRAESRNPSTLIPGRKMKRRAEDLLGGNSIKARSMADESNSSLLDGDGAGAGVTRSDVDFCI